MLLQDLMAQRLFTAPSPWLKQCYHRWLRLKGPLFPPEVTPCRSRLEQLNLHDRPNKRQRMNAFNYRVTVSLFAEGVALSAIAQRSGTPTYVHSRAHIEAQKRTR
jgi:hypothetical protein